MLDWVSQQLELRLLEGITRILRSLRAKEQNARAELSHKMPSLPNTLKSLLISDATWMTNMKKCNFATLMELSVAHRPTPASTCSWHLYNCLHGHLSTAYRTRKLWYGSFGTTIDRPINQVDRMTTWGR
uniref:Uncharacterized protein n=1 Tax=Trichuris muris TaxID=70415 RepID=A0A5S6Q7P1_TRIMR